jgi:hypothetical protein
MLESKQKLASVKNDAEVNRLELFCKSLDRQIDETVYELYGLTEEEIRIVQSDPLSVSPPFPAENAGRKKRAGGEG